MYYIEKNMYSKKYLSLIILKKPKYIHSDKYNAFFSKHLVPKWQINIL